MPGEPRRFFKTLKCSDFEADEILRVFRSLVRNNVNDSADSVGSVEYALGAADDFDTLDIV